MQSLALDRTAGANRIVYPPHSPQPRIQFDSINIPLDWTLGVQHIPVRGRDFKTLRRRWLACTPARRAAKFSHYYAKVCCLVHAHCSSD